MGGITIGKQSLKLISQYTDMKGKKNLKSYCKSDHKHKEQQRDKHENVQKGFQNHTMWGRRVRTA